MYNPWEKLAALIMGLRKWNAREGIKLRGEVRLEFYDKDNVLINCVEEKNFIVDLGLETVIDILSNDSGSFDGHKIFRMAVGDDGTLAGQPYVPKVPDATWPAMTTMFHEVMRKNIDTVDQPTSKSMRFTCSFSSADITAGSYTSSPYVLNEGALIISDGTQSVSARDEIEQGYAPTADEKIFSLRTFKSQPFDPADTLTLTVIWTIFVQ